MPDSDRDEDLRRYSNQFWQVHEPRWRQGAHPPDDFSVTRPDERRQAGATWSQVTEDGLMIIYVREEGGGVRMDVVSPDWPFPCMRTWAFRLPDWEVEEALSGRRVVWIELCEEEGPCDVTVGYRRFGGVEYVEIPAGAILPPRSQGAPDWRMVYGRELMEHVSLAYALEGGLSRVYRRAGLSETSSYRQAMELRLAGESIRSIARIMGQGEGGSGRKRVEDWIDAALEAIKDGFRIGGPPLCVSGDGTSGGLSDPDQSQSGSDGSLPLAAGSST